MRPAATKGRGGGAAQYHCEKCGTALRAQPWMLPGGEYWCWPCGKAFLEAGIGAVQCEPTALSTEEVGDGV